MCFKTQGLGRFFCASLEVAGNTLSYNGAKHGGMIDGYEWISSNFSTQCAFWPIIISYLFSIISELFRSFSDRFLYTHHNHVDQCRWRIDVAVCTEIMATIAEAIEAEDAVLLTALLLPKPQPIQQPSDAAVKLCGASLTFSAAQECGLSSSVASSIARSTLFTHAPNNGSNELLSQIELNESLDTQLTELVSLWNTSVQEEFRVSDPTDLADAILEARSQIATDHANTLAANAATNFARARARAMRADTAAAVLDALEHDSKERSRTRCAGDAAAACAIARGNAIISKLRLLRSTIAAELYDPPAVSALRDAARALERQITELEPIANESASKIARYRAIEAESPEEYSRVVREYRSLMRALDEKKWSLQELGATK